VETDIARNDLESYILTMRDKVGDERELKSFASDADRTAFEGLLTSGEDWLYDNYEGKRVDFIEKLDSIKKVGSPISWRQQEFSQREDLIAAVLGTIGNYRGTAANPGEKYGHIAADKLQSIIKECTDLETWLLEAKEKQAAMQKYERPALLCVDMEKKNTELAKMADKILAEKKPEPPKPKPEEKKEEAKTDAPADAKDAPAAEAEAEAPKTAEGPENMDVD